MNKNKNKLIGGVYYGLHNVGDEAILKSMIREFNDENGLTVLSYGSDWIRNEFDNVNVRKIQLSYSKPILGYYASPKKEVFSNIRKLRNEKLFYKNFNTYICGGATILSDCPWYSVRTAQLAGEAGNNVFLWGVGMADQDIGTAAQYIKSILNTDYVKRVYTRDQFVTKRLIKCGVNADKITESFDPAIMLNARKCDLTKYLTKKQISLLDNGKDNIVVSISGEADVVNRTPIGVLTEIINMLNNEYDYNIFLIPMGLGKQCMDLSIMNKIENDIARDNVTVVRSEFDPCDLIYFLNNVKLIISSRLHMNILGACADVPSIGLVRNSKITDFAKLMGLPYISFNDLNKDRIKKLLNSILEEYNDYIDNIKNTVDRMRTTQYEKLSELNTMMEQ